MAGRSRGRGRRRGGAVRRRGRGQGGDFGARLRMAPRNPKHSDWSQTICPLPISEGFQIDLTHDSQSKFPSTLLFKRRKVHAERCQITLLKNPLPGYALCCDWSRGRLLLSPTGRCWLCRTQPHTTRARSPLGGRCAKSFDVRESSPHSEADQSAAGAKAFTSLSSSTALFEAPECPELPASYRSSSRALSEGEWRRRA